MTVQTEFTETGELQNVFSTPPKPEPSETLTPYQCPYCLFASQLLGDFIPVYGRKKAEDGGFASKKMKICPKCHANLRVTTLIKIGKMDLHEYAKELASYADWDVNRKVKWNLIFEALNPLSQESRKKFWEEYREARAAINPEYAVRKATKEYEESWGDTSDSDTSYKS